MAQSLEINMTAMLQRITSEYVAQEDRVRVSGECANGSTVVLWLTQRILNRLVPHLVGWLDGKAGAEPVAQVVQEFAQHTARAQLSAQAPVRAASAGAHSVLVHAVDMGFNGAGVALKFKDQADKVVACLQLQATPLRQWINILHDQYRQAGWPAGVWPQWVTGATDLQQTSCSPVLH